MFEEIDDMCDDIGCTRNDWIKDTLQDKLREESNDETEDQEIKFKPKPQIQTNNEVNESEIKKDKQHVIINLDADKPIPKAEIRIIDNSNKPQIEMVEFNGNRLPFAKRYNI